MKPSRSLRELVFATALIIPPGHPAIEIKGFRMVEAKEEKRQLELKASRARLYKPEDLMALDKLEAQLWNKGKKPYILTGEVGVLDSNTQNFQIFKTTQVKSPDGYRFDTSNVKYDHSNQKILTDEIVDAVPTNARAPAQFKISGIGLIIDLETQQYQILKNVRTDQKLGPKNGISIRSQSVVIDPNENRATFKNSVTVKSPTIDMKGERLQISFASSAESEEGEKELLHPQELLLDSPKAFGKQMIKATIGNLKIQSKGLKIHLNSEGSVEKSEALGSVDGLTDDGVKLKAETLISDIFEGKQRIILKDNVEILTNARIAHCQDAQYFPDTGQIVLEKVASVKTDDQIIEGEIIRFSTKDSEITVEKAKGELNKSSVFKK